MIVAILGCGVVPTTHPYAQVATWFKASAGGTEDSRARVRVLRDIYRLTISGRDFNRIDKLPPDCGLAHVRCVQSNGSALIMMPQCKA